MKISLNNAPPHEIKTACLVIGVLEDAPLSGPAREMDEASGGRLRALIDSRATSTQTAIASRCCTA